MKETKQHVQLNSNAQLNSNVSSKSGKENSCIVTDCSISCGGIESLSNHPLVYLEIDPAIGYINCPYCNHKFLLDRHNT